MGYVPAGRHGGRRKEPVDFAPLGGGHQLNGRAVIPTGRDGRVNQDIRVEKGGRVIFRSRSTSAVAICLLVLLVHRPNPSLRVFV